jgi:hypothetical protein
VYTWLTCPTCQCSFCFWWNLLGWTWESKRQSLTTCSPSFLELLLVAWIFWPPLVLQNWVYSSYIYSDNIYYFIYTVYLYDIMYDIWHCIFKVYITSSAIIPKLVNPRGRHRNHLLKHRPPRLLRTAMYQGVPLIKLDGWEIHYTCVGFIGK